MQWFQTILTAGCDVSPRSSAPAGGQRGSASTQVIKRENPLMKEPPNKSPPCTPRPPGTLGGRVLQRC